MSSPDARGFVYLLGKGEHVKIGWAKNPTNRCGVLQTASVERITLLVRVPGSKLLERALHRRFAAFRVKGEWFTASPEIRTLFDAIILDPSLADAMSQPPSAVPAPTPLEHYRPTTLAGLRLREWRERQFLTQSEAAERLGIKQPSLCDYERGRAFPEVRRALTIDDVTEGFVSVRSWAVPACEASRASTRKAS